MSHRLLSALLLLPGLFTGCASIPSSDSPRYLHEVPVGTVLSLERALTFEEGTLRVYLQDGQTFARRALILDYGGASLYKPLCTLELRDKTTSVLTLTPRQYTISSVKRDVSYQSFDTSEFRTEWRLSGGGEPAAMYFTCYRLGREASDPPITMQEVDRAVGTYFRLKAAEAGEQVPQN